MNHEREINEPALRAHREHERELVARAEAEMNGPAHHVALELTEDDPLPRRRPRLGLRW